MEKTLRIRGSVAAGFLLTWHEGPAAVCSRYCPTVPSRYKDEALKEGYRIQYDCPEGEATLPLEERR